MTLLWAVQASIVVALESDFARVQGIVEEGVHALSARPTASSMGCAAVLGGRICAASGCDMCRDNLLGLRRPCVESVQKGCHAALMWYSYNIQQLGSVELCS